MFSGGKTKLPAIITFTDGNQLHCDLAPGSTPGLMSAISGENPFIEVYVESKRKFYARRHVLCIEEDSAAMAAKEQAA